MISRRTLAALALASVAHIASAHDCGAETAWSCQSLADAIPSCPRSCFNQETFGCELDDWDCRCTYKNSMFEETANCVSMDCTESVEEAQQAFEDLCACVASNGNPSASCSSPSSSAPVVVSSASPSSSAPPSFVSSVVSASVTPSSSLPPSFVPISSFPVFSSSAAISSAVSSSAPISSAPSSVISSASSALPSSASCTDDSESCIPPASTLATFLDYPASSPAVVTSSGKPTSTPSAAYPFTNSSTISYVVKPTGYPVDGGYPTPSKSVGGYAPGLYPNSTTIKTVYPQATTTCTDDKSVPTGAPYPGSDKPGNGNNGGEYKPAPVEEKPYEGVPSAPKPEYPGSGSGSGSESGSGSYPGSGSDSGSYPGSSSGSSSDSYPGSGSDSGSGSYPGSGSDSASYPGSGSGSGSGSDSGSYPGSGSGSAYQPVASTSVSAVSPVGQDDSYVVTAGVARGSELATGGVAFAAFIVGLGLL